MSLASFLKIKNTENTDNGGIKTNEHDVCIYRSRKAFLQI